MFYGAKVTLGVTSTIVDLSFKDVLKFLIPVKVMVSMQCSPKNKNAMTEYKEQVDRMLEDATHEILEDLALSDTDTEES